MPALWAQHPTYDGRGAVAAEIDGLPDVGHPALQRARDIKGHSVRKILEVYVPAQNRRKGWLKFEEHGDTAVQTKVTIEGRTYRKPLPGRFLYAVMNERKRCRPGEVRKHPRGEGHTTMESQRKATRHDAYPSRLGGDPYARECGPGCGIKMNQESDFSGLFSRWDQTTDRSMDDIYPELQSTANCTANETLCLRNGSG